MLESSNPLLDTISTKIKQLGLQDISLFVLESHLPLSNIIAHLAYLVPPVFGKEYLELLKDKNSIEMLINKLKDQT
jgi:hypothetical protein